MAKSHLFLLLTLALVATIAGLASAAGWDDDLPQRQEAMLDAVHVMANYDPASKDPRALKRAVATVNGEMALLRPIFKAVSQMPEATAAEVRAKEEARAAANELLTRHLGQLLPGDGAKIVDDL